MSDISNTKEEVADHTEQTGAHHTRYSDSEARTATDGQIDADTVDGKHASDIGASQTQISGPIGSGYVEVMTFSSSDGGSTQWDDIADGWRWDFSSGSGADKTISMTGYDTNGNQVAANSTTVPANGSDSGTYNFSAVAIDKVEVTGGDGYLSGDFDMHAMGMPSHQHQI